VATSEPPRHLRADEVWKNSRADPACAAGAAGEGAVRVPVYLTPKQTEFLIEQAERQLKEVTSMPKATLRDVINKAIEHAYESGAEWALIQSGMDSPEAGRTVKKWRRQRPAPGLKLIQKSAQEDILEALVAAVIDQKECRQASLLGESAQ